MCIILLCKARKPSEKEIMNCFESNPDGIGVMYYKNNKHYFKKGINTVKELMKILENLPLPLAIHFRLRSIGVKHPLLTHPFICSSKGQDHHKLEGVTTKPLLMHNGTFSRYQELALILKLNKPKLKFPNFINDSLILAMAYSYLNDDLFKIYETIGDKIVILKNNKFITIGNFIEFDGILASNRDIEGWRNYIYYFNWNANKKKNNIMPEYEPEY